MLLLLALAACAPRSANTRDAEAEEAALAAARAWLAQVDAGQYEASWDAAAGPFKTAVDREEWTPTVEGVRAPLGTLVTRELQSATFTTELPGAPDGEYVVFQFRSAFADKEKAVETVTPMKEADGAWRVSGYYLK